MNAICLMELEIGLITIAGPLILFLLTITLSTKGWSYCFIHKEKGVISSSGTVCYPFFSFSGSPTPLKFLSTSSVSVSTFANFKPSKVSNSLKIASSM